MKVYELIYGVLFHPAATFRYLGEEKPLARVTGIWLLAHVFSVAVSLSMLRGGLVTEFSRSFGISTERVGSLLWLHGLAVVVCSFVVWFVTASLYAMLAELWYTAGNGAGVLASLGLASVPGAFGPALQFIGQVTGVEFITKPLVVGVFLWTVVLQIIALRESLRIETTRAVAVWVTPVAVTVAAGLLMIILACSAIGSAWPTGV